MMDTIMERMMAFMMGRMSDEEKHAMMDSMMEKFFAGMSTEDKENLMKEMMPQMMEGIDMMKMMPNMMMSMMGGGPEGKGGCGDMMSGMMTGHKAKGMTMMPDMMMEMMPHCLSMMLPHAPEKKRVEFVRKMVSILAEKGCAGMTEEQKKELFEVPTERGDT
ncbi:MAG: hypothetical protein GTO67_16050 [Gammaproteobacteria bacterium]|nr:hypothetical protein [Gammaproteobacteria bacterium]NIO26272.1 hypothetical protein [Gammaproteobacteria bacterium]NIP66033.1 hypothetical protein [Gammaproteobacteria bacterium]NIQ27179.1 hypothetical protein [Gammaproteobacteria bacterium]NIR20349.1 hypothetical protein [Gammaproteobacteria bacterium]